LTDPSGLDSAAAQADSYSFVDFPVHSGRYGESSRLRRQWEQGRTQFTTKRLNATVGDETASVRASFGWFREADADDVMAYLGAIRCAITRILEDFRGYDPTNRGRPSETEAKFNRWFGNGQQLNRRQFEKVWDVYTEVKNGIDTGTTTFYDKSDSVSYYGYTNLFFLSTHYRTIALGRDYFDGSRAEKIGTLIHEMTHLYAGTDDYGYYTEDSLDAANPVRYTLRRRSVTPNADQLVNNADSYAGLLVQYYD
jgi:hypothetical protein